VSKQKTSPHRKTIQLGNKRQREACLEASPGAKHTYVGHT